MIAELASKGLPRSKGPIVPDRFTARKFEGTEGDYKEYMTPEGFKRTETTWVYPPTYYEPGAIESGQTYPFFIGSPDPKDDGLRARLPQGKVMGVSPLLAKQRQEQAEQLQRATQEVTRENVPPVPQRNVLRETETPPPVPQHKDFRGHLSSKAGHTAAGR